MLAFARGRCKPGSCRMLTSFGAQDKIQMTRWSLLYTTRYMFACFPKLSVISRMPTSQRNTCNASSRARNPMTKSAKRHRRRSMPHRISQTSSCQPLTDQTTSDPVAPVDATTPALPDMEQVVQYTEYAQRDLLCLVSKL